MVEPLAAVPNYVLVLVGKLAVVGLALATGCREETLLGFATAANARRIVGVVNAT
jgi:hypothetical protein